MEDLLLKRIALIYSDKKARREYFVTERVPCCRTFCDKVSFMYFCDEPYEY